MSPRSPTKKRRGYISVGVQTIPREMRSQGVQVSTILPRTLAPARSSRRSWPPASSADPLQPVLARDVTPGLDPNTTTPPRSKTFSKPASLSASSDILFPRFPYPASPDRSPSAFKAPTVPTLTTQTVTPPKTMMQTPPPSSVQTMDSPSAASPLSSVGPLSPPENSVSLPTRKAGRVWDPARGVEAFKRGSEEVLARFAKMGSWENDLPARS
jgi:glycogenin